MNDNEKQFEDFVRDIKFDDIPDPEHRDKLEQDLLAAFQKQPRQINIWRIIMKSRITKLATAAVILAGILVAAWSSSNTSTHKTMSSFNMLSRACAAEQTLFYSTRGIVHIVNEIVLYPEQQRDVGELLADLESDATNDKNIAFIKSWLSYKWLPVYSLRADGQPREHKLELAKHTDGAVTVSDLAWYEPTTGRFVRVLKTGDHVLFANAYDGESIYLARKETDGELHIEQEPMAYEFHEPDNPVDFLGIAAGIKGSVPMEHFPPIQDVTTETLDDGTQVRAYKLGFADPWGKVDTYFVFKIGIPSDIIYEIECVVKGRTTRIHRRIVAETVDSPGYSWNLAEIGAATTGQTSVAIDSDESYDIVTIEEMSQRATFPVYVFADDPPWTSDRKIYDLPDEASTPNRLFVITYRANDGRDVVLTQGESFNRYFTAAFRKFNELGEQLPVLWTYESESGFKALHQDDKKGEMWWTEFALKSSGFEPTANRVGYILQSPAETFMVLAINGPIGEQELKNLIDSLIPADEYVTSSVQPARQ